MRVILVEMNHSKRVITTVSHNLIYFIPPLHRALMLNFINVSDNDNFWHENSMYQSISPYATYRTYSSLHIIFFVDWQLLSFQKY